MLRLLGISREKASRTSLSREELRTVVAEASTVIPHRHQRMLMSILDLERINVEDIMVPRNEIAGIDVSDEWDDILDQLRDSRHTRIPVYDGNLDELVGILHMKKVARLLARGEFDREQLVALAQAREPYYVPEGTSLNKQLLNFQRQRRRVAFVVDEYGDVQGLVTLEDLLEEIVGEFTSDTSSLHKDVHREKGGTLHRQRVGERAHAEPQDGLVAAHDRPAHAERPDPRVPRDDSGAGTSLRVNDYAIDILQTGDNAVKTVRLQPIAPSRAPRPRRQKAAASACSSRATPSTSSPSTSPCAARSPAGTSARRKPCFAASRSRSSPNGTGPDLAGEPELAEADRCPAATGRLRRLDSTASTAGRSAAVSPMRTPPTTLTNTSWPGRSRCRRAGAARRAAARAGSTRIPPRRAAATCPGPRRPAPAARPAVGRLPSRATVTTLPGTGDLVPRKEDRRGIADFLEPLLGHREHADLVGGAEAVLDRAHDAEAAAGIALEIQHGVDHVLEDARPGDQPFLGHVADDQHRGAGILGEPHQPRRGFAHLHGRAGRRLARARCAWSGSSRPPARSRARPTASSRIASTRVSATSRSVPDSSPSRRARSATCRTDSSPDAYSTG